MIGSDRYETINFAVTVHDISTFQVCPHEERRIAILTKLARQSVDTFWYQLTGDTTFWLYIQQESGMSNARTHTNRIICS